MDLRLKYFGQVTCTETGDVIRFEIHEKDHLGGAAERRLVENGVVMSTDGPGSRDHYKPLLTNTAECLLWDENGDIAASLETATDFSHKLFIYRNEIIEFVGWMRVEPVASTLNAFPGQIVVSAVCGLALLKNIPFLDDADLLFTGQISFKNLIWNCLKKLGVGLDFYLASNWWVPSLATGETDPEPLEWLFTYAETFLTTNGDPVSCEQVLIEVMKAFNLQIRQGRGAWHVVQRELLFSGTYHRRKYDIATGSTTAVGDFNPAQTLTETQAQALREWGGQKTYLPGLQAAQVRFVYDELPTVIENGDLSGVQSPRAAPGPRDTSRAGFRGGVRPGGGSGPRGGRVGRGGGARGRGQDPAGFAGRGNRTTPSTNRRLNWFDKSDVAITASDVGDGQGPNGENILFQDPVAAGSVAAVTSSYPDYLTEVEAGAWHYVEGRVVNGGTDKKLRVEVSTFLDESGNQEPNGVFYPVYYKVRLNNIDTGAFKWLSLSLDADDYHTWSDPEVALNFLGPSGLLNDIPARNGVEGEVWTTDIRLSEDIPSGAWRVRVYLFPCFDWQRRGVASGPHPLKTTKGQKWTNVFVDLLVEGEYDRTSEIRTALDVASDHTMLFGLDCVLGGPAPFFDMAGSVVHATDQVGDNWKINRYAGEGDTGISLTEINAKALFRQQGEIVEVQRANIHPTTDDYFLLAPHEVLEIDGDRFQLGTINYNYLSGAWGGQFIRIRQVTDAPTVDILNERDTGFFRFGGAPVGAFISNADGVFNRSQQNAIAKTDAVIASGLRTQITVTGMTTAVEANDKIIMIDALGNDYQFTLTANKAIGATTWDIDDDALLGAGFNFPRNVDYPAGLFLREAFIRSAFIQTRDSIRAVVRGDEVCRLNETISTPTVRTSATVTPLLVALVDNDELELINEGSDTPTKLTVNGAHAKSATTLNFDSQTIEGTTNDSIKLDGAWLRAELTIQKDEIDLRVTKEFYDDRQGSLVARLNGAQSGVKTSIVVEWANLESGTGTHFKLKVGEVIKIIHASDPDIVQYVRVTADEVAGSTSIAIADAADSTATNVTLLSFADESMVYLHQAVPEVVTTGINIKLGTIKLDAKSVVLNADSHLKSNNWDGTLDANNRITAPGTVGYCITGDGDADITGTLHFGGGVAGGGGEAGSGGIQLDADADKFSGGSVDWWVGGTGGTRQFSVGCDVDLGAVVGAYVETIPAIDLNLISGQSLNLSALTGTIYFKTNDVNMGSFSTGALYLPDGTTAQRPTPTNGMIRYNTTLAKFEGYEAGAWTNMIGGGTTAITDDVVPKGTGPSIEDSNWSITDAGVLSSAAAGAKIGISTASPFDLLANTSSNITDESGTGTTGGSGITFRVNSGGYVQGLRQNSVASNAMGLLVRIEGVASTNNILTLNSGGADRFVVRGDGRVGIGLVSPLETLHVSGTLLVTGPYKSVSVQEWKNQPAGPLAPASGFTSLYTLDSDDRFYFREGASGQIHKIITDQDVIGDVLAAAVIADHRIVRGDGGVKGVQDSAITLDDDGDMHFPSADRILMGVSDNLILGYISSKAQISTSGVETLWLRAGGIDKVEILALADGPVRIKTVLDIVEDTTPGVPASGHARLFYTLGDNFGFIQSSGVTHYAVKSIGDSTLLDHRLIRGDGGTTGVQDSGVTLDDSNNLSGVVEIQCQKVNRAVGTLIVKGQGLSLQELTNTPRLTVPEDGDIELVVGGALPSRLVFTGLPTSDPGGTGRVWDNSGVLNIT